MQHQGVRQVAFAFSLRWSIVIVAVFALGGCAIVSEFKPSVTVRAMAPDEYVALRRGDVLGTGKLSALTVQALRVAEIDERACATSTSLACIAAIAAVKDMDEETRTSALAELWLQHAVSISMSAPYTESSSTSAWIETARYAYAYLFFTRRVPGERAFEERQTQVRDWYNYAVQKTVAQLFGVRQGTPDAKAVKAKGVLRLGDWALRVDLNARLPNGVAMPRELLPASALRFQGLRGIYRRDGLGAELVAVTDAQSLTNQNGLPTGDDFSKKSTAWNEMPTPNVTVVLRFDVRSMEELLASHELVVAVYDPLVQDYLSLHGQRVPLAGNFTAGYGLWLARSEFNRQSLLGLLGRDRGIDQPRLYLMQPFDPQRRIIVMLHGLASSPEAWVNVANELLADEELRCAFQVWQVYYPTNMPLPANHAAIRQVLLAALHHFDPEDKTAASHGLVLVGHSMGGVLARLMVSTSDQQLLKWAESDPRIDLNRLGKSRAKIDPLLQFQPFRGVERVIFIATPHRGTVVAGQGFGRWVAGLVRLPLKLLEALAGAIPARADTMGTTQETLLERIPNSIDQLDEKDPFVKAAAELPISDRESYHSIIARQNTDGSLADSDDGLVPYRSAHLEGAASERIIVSGHSVQETAASIAEITRILREVIARHQLTTADLPPAERRGTCLAY